MNKTYFTTVLRFKTRNRGTIFLEYSLSERVYRYGNFINQGCFGTVDIKVNVKLYELKQALTELERLGYTKI